ncbi:Nramp family divalent metal transporter [Shewanella woodyi]|uniref:Natural resistance-associated macrophage protein n=1 Tax=Shewanella woodyi (strain ATCC 51908 / MS32) TaxID=392500 RepID=B1KQS0_SHEWM|nr:Nramp family divalent metal transporter [Shewanella woodyi]ACA87676.1 natural resistance-associated macrophage protein [Shewanella woodyi ATCC 51908]
MSRSAPKIGPGAFIAAAFIGPGTVTLCTIAGVKFGYGLLWVMLLSIVATYTLQEMSARLGLITQKGLAAVIKEQINSTVLRNITLLLIFSAIVVGNIAYEAGNITGASLGLSAIFGESSLPFLPLLIGSVSAILLFIGSYKLLERVLIGLVIAMSLSFFITAILTKPDLGAVLSGLFTPQVSSQNILMVIGLIGTTVVPYNLFLHASLVKEVWQHPNELKFVKQDTLISIGFGGIISMAIIICAASIQGDSVENLLDLAKGLNPLFGTFSSLFLGIGLFAAGITSAITAPLAAAFVGQHCFGWKANLKDWRFRTIWLTVIIVGVISSSLQLKPIEIIKFAQIANGLLLPLLASLLLWIVNKTQVLGQYKNSLRQNLIGAVVIAITLVLSIKTLYSLF